jgi:PAS domain S-box-containing protein
MHRSEITSLNLVHNRAQAFLKIIQTHRLWNARHGGVYVPITDETVSNPYLDDPLRDITSTDGIKLTKINPAYMTRQVAKLAKEQGGVIFHITSLNSIRPQNAPGQWETVALKEFEKGSKEKLELLDINSVQFYKYMAPLYVKDACLKCHAKQGYKLNDIRGGISISFPAKPFNEALGSQRKDIILLHFGIFLGVSILLAGYRYRTLRSGEDLKASEERFRGAFENAAIGATMVDFKGSFLRVNSAFCGLLGYTEDELMPKTFSDVTHPDDMEIGLNELKRLAAGEYERTTFEKRYICKDGSVIHTIISPSLIRDAEGSPSHCVTLVQDITERKKIEEEISKSLKEKEVLLKEVHHRVKNNMAVISSLLSLQSRHINDKQAQEKFKETKGRITAMALVHEKLYQTENFSEIDVKDYVQTLVQQVKSTFAADKSYSIITDIDKITVEIDTLIPCGLIINEILTNAYKHAFDGADNPTIRVIMKKIDNGGISLTISDNGVGLPEGFDINQSTGLGLQLVNLLAFQIKGTLEVKSDQGTAFAIIFPAKLEIARYHIDG